MTLLRRLAPPVAVAATLVLAGCASNAADPGQSEASRAAEDSPSMTEMSGMPMPMLDDDDIRTDAVSTPTGTTDMSEGHGGMDVEVMDEPDATPADELSDVDVARGTFTLLESAPDGFDGVGGEGIVAQTEDGTTVTIRVQGWQADADVASHLHAGTCAQDGGPHFAFDPDGGDMPPNEIHLGGTADADGSLVATVTNARRVEDAATSVVIHTGAGEKVACADLG